VVQIGLRPLYDVALAASSQRLSVDGTRPQPVPPIFFGFRWG
jgi:hypothetical protein